ncbi:MAG: hypothetical protein O7E52_22410 [Candidatus Poribacteria bacterium]|nr:hypothetical protein [Candidatus Poribacteria bacterium]
MSIKQQITQELDGLKEAELIKVAKYVAFLKLRHRAKTMPSVDEKQLATLYAEFAEEDVALAEGGMVHYAEALAKEDTQ